MGTEEDNMPVALGIIRDVEAPTYENEQAKQIEMVQAKNPKPTFESFLLSSSDVWEVK